MVSVANIPRHKQQPRPYGLQLDGCRSRSWTVQRMQKQMKRRVLTTVPGKEEPLIRSLSSAGADQRYEAIPSRSAVQQRCRAEPPGGEPGQPGHNRSARTGSAHERSGRPLKDSRMNHRDWIDGFMRNDTSTVASKHSAHRSFSAHTEKLILSRRPCFAWKMRGS